MKYFLFFNLPLSLIFFQSFRIIRAMTFSGLCCWARKIPNKPKSSRSRANAAINSSSKSQFGHMNSCKRALAALKILPHYHGTRAFQNHVHRDRSLTLGSPVVILARNTRRHPLFLLSALVRGVMEKKTSSRDSDRGVEKSGRGNGDGLIAVVIRYDKYGALHFPSHSTAHEDLRVCWWTGG